jgi:hypothetical protein
MARSRHIDSDDRVRAVQERRRSGGHGLHKDSRGKRLGTRSAVLAAEIALGW